MTHRFHFAFRAAYGLICAFPGITQAELARLLQYSRERTGRIVLALERQRLISTKLVPCPVSRPTRACYPLELA